VSTLERLRRLEAELEFLRAERQRLERLLALSLRVAVGGSACGPLDLLGALEDLDAEAWRLEMAA